MTFAEKAKEECVCAAVHLLALFSNAKFSSLPLLSLCRCSGAATGSSLDGWLAGSWEGNNIKDMARRPDNGRYVNDLIRCSGPLVSNAASLWPPAFCAHGTRERGSTATRILLQLATETAAVVSVCLIQI